MTSESLLILQEIADTLRDEPELLKSLSKILDYSGSYTEMSSDVVVPAENTEISQKLTADTNQNKPFKDLRLRRLVFVNFRTFPETEYKPYAVKFENDKGPCSTFLVGRNGTGKSTIFDAIEFYFADKVSNAEQKGIKEVTDIQKYLTFGFNEIPKIRTENVFLEIKTQEGDEKVELMKRGPVCQPAPFCSDHDIYKIAALENSNLYEYIFEQLGYSELLNLQKGLNRISDLQSINLMDKGDDSSFESEQVFLDTGEVETVIKAFMENYQQNHKGILLNQCDIYAKKTPDQILEEVLTSEFLQEDLNKSGRFFPEKWEELQKNAEEFVEQEKIYLLAKFKEKSSSIITAKKLVLMYSLLYDTFNEDAVGAFNLFVNMKKKAEQLEMEQVGAKRNREKLIATNRKAAAIANRIKALLDKAINNIVEDFIEQYHSFIESTLVYFSERFETFFLKLDKGVESKVSLNIIVSKDEGTFPSTPNKYLNSFRFKLYAIALKLSLAFWYMKKNRCILPVAIDDVFNANDFENSGRLQQFVHKIYQAYHDKVSDTIPLQVIVLTHDEMILNAFRKGFNVQEISRWGESEEEREKSKQTYNLYSGKCIVGRLFPYLEAQNVYDKIHNFNLYSDILNLYIPLN